MIIPNFVQDKLVDSTGAMTPNWVMFFSQLIDQMQANLSDEGVVIPSQTTANISVIKDHDPAPLNGTIIYDSTTNQLKVKLSDGNFHVITTV